MANPSLPALWSIIVHLTQSPRVMHFHFLKAIFSDFLIGNATDSSDNQIGFCMAYVDDLIVRSMSNYGALEHYKQIFKHAAQVGMQFKPSKCTFFPAHLEVLGRIVTPNGHP